MGARYRRGLDSLSLRRLADLRQIGLWIGLELETEAGGARPYCEALKAEGMLCKDTHTHTIRIAPPLCISAEEVDWSVERIGKVFERLS